VRDKTNKRRRRENLSALGRKGGLMVEKRRTKGKGVTFSPCHFPSKIL
jgi:hypothetical protein